MVASNFSQACIGFEEQRIAPECWRAVGKAWLSKAAALVCQQLKVETVLIGWVNKDGPTGWDEWLFFTIFWRCKQKHSD